MEGIKCLVECWADFGDLLTARVSCNGPDVILSTGTEHIFVFSVHERRVQTVLQFNSPVTSLALNPDQSSVYALCENNLLYWSPLQKSSSSSIEQGDDPALSMVPEDAVLVKDDHLLSFTVTDDILITASLHESFWTFRLYELSRHSTTSPIASTHDGFQVPAVTRVPQNDVDLQAMMNSAPTLICIFSNSSPKGHAWKRHPCLEPLLFRLLFGVDASLLNSPIILCGLPDGRLVFFPLLCRVLTSSQGTQKPPIKILHSIEQPVIFIGTSVIGDEGPQCLVVIGQRGRIRLIRAHERSSDGKVADCGFIEHTVQGPVVSACVDDEHLYYSTATNLFCLTLPKTMTSSSSKTVSEGDSTRPESAVCLNVCRVIALTASSIGPAGSSQLLAVSLSGRLLHVTLPQDSDKASVSRLTSTQAGQKIKDLLAGIGNVWERVTAAKQQLELKNNTLKRVNHVLNICHLLLNSPRNDPDFSDCRPPISCQGAAKWSSLLQKDSLVLTCTLENQSSCALDQGWTLCLQVQSSLSTSAGGSFRTYSFALTKLDCGQKAEVTVPLESDGDLFLPVQVHCSLMHTLESLFNPEEYRQLSAHDTSLSQFLTHTGCIALALNTITLDWLDALRIGEPSTNGDQIPKQISTWESTRMFLSSRQIHTDEPVMPKAAPYTIAIHISSELLRNQLGLPDCSSSHLCITVLKWLLCGASKTEGQEIVQSPVVCARGPDTQAVRLLTKEVILSDFHSEGPMSVVEVQVQSVSMCAVCGLHHAVLRRIQGLLKDAVVKPEKSAELKGQRLCEAVRHMEHLYQNLHDFFDPADALTKTRRTTESLFRLYMQLREKPLVIL